MNPIALTQDETCALQFFKSALLNVPRRGRHYTVLRTDAWANLQFAHFRNIHHADMPQAYRSDLPRLVDSLWIKTREALKITRHHTPEDRLAGQMLQKIIEGGGKGKVFIAPQARMLADIVKTV